MTKSQPKDWFYFAVEDVTVANAAYKEGVYNLACFHAQQAAEKLLKACLASHGLSLPKTHILRELYTRVIPETPNLKAYFGMLVSFDRYYIPTRYPDALPGSLPEGLPTKEDAREAIAEIEKFSEFIQSVIQKQKKR